MDDASCEDCLGTFASAWSAASAFATAFKKNDYTYEQIGAVGGGGEATRELVSVSLADVQDDADLGKWTVPLVRNCGAASGFCHATLSHRTKESTGWTAETVDVLHLVDQDTCPNFECLGSWQVAWCAESGTCSAGGGDSGWVAGWRNNTYVYETAETGSTPAKMRELLSVSNPDQLAMAGKWDTPLDRGCSDASGFCRGVLDSREYRDRSGVPTP